MDFRYLIENGNYNVDDLTADRRAYVDGMTSALEAADNFLAGFMTDPDDENTLEKAEREIREETIAQFKEYMTDTITETIIALLDDQWEEENDS